MEKCGGGDRFSKISKIVATLGKRSWYIAKTFNVGGGRGVENQSCIRQYFRIFPLNFDFRGQRKFRIIVRFLANRKHFLTKVYETEQYSPNPSAEQRTAQMSNPESVGECWKIRLKYSSNLRNVLSGGKSLEMVTIVKLDTRVDGQLWNCLCNSYCGVAYVMLIVELLM